MTAVSFENTGLDARLLRSLAKLGLSTPTPVQAEAVPRALEGKDIVARARTGSGKTLAYLLPALHRILTSGDPKAAWRALVLVPTRELCEQVRSEALAVAQHCGAPITATALTADAPVPARAAVAAAGALVVSTPGRIATALREGWLVGSHLAARLQLLVLDEADLLLSYGYEEDLQVLAPQVPRSCQCLLMSATSSADVERLQKLVLHNPIVLNLLQSGSSKDGANGLDAGGSGTASEITHHYYRCSKDDKLLVTLALLKLGLLRKKILVFVNTVDNGVRLRLLLESFGVRSALLNAELPLNSRSHILQSFNKGLFDILIATDDVHSAATQQHQPPKKKRRTEQHGKHKQQGKPQKDEEFGVTRGIDFKGVRTILNYDLPASVQGYVHRVGRTGRAGQAGSAITLFTPADASFQQELQAALGGQQEQQGQQERQASHAAAGPSGAAEDSDEDEDGDGAAGEGQSAGLRPYTRLTSAAMEALRYRAEDVARGITRNAVREARAKELRVELLNSERLKDYFEDHTAEQALLRHDKPLHSAPQADHLRHVPAYLRAAAGMTGPSRSAVGGKRQGSSDKAKVPLTKRQRTKRAGTDPLAAIGFAHVGKRGGGEQELTEGEKRAEVLAAKRSKELKKKAHAGDAAAAAALSFVPKRNVRKAGARRR